MRVISRGILRNFCEDHADSCESLYEWYRVAVKLMAKPSRCSSYL
jgi:mRNA interferase HigB